MKKTFPLNSPRHAHARVVESIKHDVRKYVKRERKKPVPPEFDLWSFDCRVGTDSQSAVATSLTEVGAAIDQVAESQATAVYVEVVAIPAKRTSLPTGPSA